ncbi:hypothetical protein ADL15_26870 [Actinoplanes awajinensis subsp. mycoplanecinus]|uniref:Cell shape-determining protein MreB n=2 Tax=Actinoplanes awajinensis TaxID=135946 RepID=A0A101JMV5_9ACTN|nr:hypothetical protein ADL15_26870 [Actinoplanes awajinensis subsp. mycoplanecinus]
MKGTFMDNPAEPTRPKPATAVAVDLGSGTTGVWTSHRGVVSGSSDRNLVHRGRIVDVDGCTALLKRIVQQYPQPVPAADMVVACRPVLSTDADEALMRRVLDEVFTPRRILFVDSVRAAAIGAGATAGSLLIADVGTQLTETALLENGRVVEARRAELGTRDLGSGTTVGLLGDVVARHVDQLRAACPDADLAAATARGLLLVGDGALHPDLPAALAAELGMRVHVAAAPRQAALTGAGLAVSSALRHPALSGRVLRPYKK